MSHKYKHKSKGETPLPTSDPAADYVRVADLIANGDSGTAIDLAKAVHKRYRTLESETLLMDAYVKRVTALMNWGLHQQATALVEQVTERYPLHRQRFKEVSAILKPRGSVMEGLLEMLADPAQTPASRVLIEGRIRLLAEDPARIATCELLPPEHPLRVAAGAAARALVAVTSGPVAAGVLALPEVSRTSPMAPWKMMIRAIAAFYANDDALCEKYLAAVAPAAPAFRLAPALRVMMGQKVKRTPEVLTLAGQVDGGSVEVRTALTALDDAWDSRNHKLIVLQIGNAVTACKRFTPELLEALKQQISIRSMLEEVKADRVASAMGGPSLKNANFWRLLARAHEESRKGRLDVPQACSAWEEFRRHAIHEKWFPADGPEVAALYLHMADLWRRISDDEIEDVAVGFASKFPGHREYYNGQPSEIRQLKLEFGKDDFYYLSPYPLLERACQADPCAENFERWLKWADGYERGEEVATLWAAALPRDIRPLLRLMKSAEERSAYKKAFKLMEQAERLDGLNPEVRKARLTLLVSMSLRHLQQKKLHLAEPELRQLEALPQAQLGDRPALLAALRWVFFTQRGDTAASNEAWERAIRLLGSSGSAANFLLLNLSKDCKLQGKAPTFEFVAPLAGGFGRVCALGEDTGIPVGIPPSLSEQLVRELSGKDPVPDASEFGALGEAAMRGEDFALAFAVSAAGLKLPDERRAEFLFLRARALPEWEVERQSLCVAAASELARRQRNLDLLRRIGEWREGELLGYGANQTDVAMTTKEIEDLVKGEQEQKSLSSGRSSRRGYARDAGDYCDCPECRARRRGPAPPSLDDLLDAMPPELARMLEDIGPAGVEQALEQIIGGGLPKRGRRRRRVIDDNDLPF